MIARAAIGALILAAATVSVATAQERIVSYDSEVRILTDGTLEVTEHITVVAEGNRIQRGIYRDFPTRYRDRYGNRVRVGFEMIGVLRNDAPEPWFTESMSNGIRINTGDDSFLPVPAQYTFTIRYRTTRQLGFFENHDELYWNAIGTGWIFPIESGSVTVTLPEPVPVQDLGAEAYTGPQGARGFAYSTELPSPGTAVYRLTEPLAPGEGLTIVLTFPKGIIQEPGTADRVRWLLADNRGVLVALAGFGFLLLFCFSRWQRVGRDPPAGVIIPRYNPPPGHSPAGLRFVRRMGYDTRCFTADVLALAVGGHLRIGMEKRRFRKPLWYLEADGDVLKRATRAAVAALAAARSDDEPDGEDPTEPDGGADRPRRGSSVEATRPQTRLLRKLFPGVSTRIELERDNAVTISAARAAHQAALKEHYQPRYFRMNEGSVVLAILIAAGTFFAAMASSGGYAGPLIFFVGALMLVTVIAFARVVRAPTKEGRALLDEVEGLKLYLSVAEKDELAMLAGPDGPPPLDAARYEFLLPYAIALDVEEAWTRKFTAAVGEAAAREATSAMTWHHGADFADLGSFSRAVGTSLTSQIASSASPPGSSSGSGGGGSSGGGGGGGGGGGR